MAPQKTYYPSRTFDDDLAAFADMCVTNKWVFPGISLADLQAAVKQQRAARSDFDKLELEYLKVKERFGIEQHERYSLYASALNAARGVFRNNKAVLAQLERFKAATGGKRKHQTGDTPPSKGKTKGPKGDGSGS